MDELGKEWVKDRIKTIDKHYNIYDALTEYGFELSDREITMQIQCPLPQHGPDNKPSARYYASSGNESSYVYCFKCRTRLTGIDLYAVKKDIKFMRALFELEKRFGVKPVDKPDFHINEEVKEAWSDIPRVLSHLENKLLRIKDKVAMLDYIKWCRIIDAVQWDFKNNGAKTTPEMVMILHKIEKLMNNAGNEYVDL